MKELLSTSDPVLLSMVRHYLEEAGIVHHVFDAFVGSLFPGDMQFAANRVMVDEDDFSRAKWLLKDLDIEGTNA